MLGVAFFSTDEIEKRSMLQLYAALDGGSS